MNDVESRLERIEELLSTLVATTSKRREFFTVEQAAMRLGLAPWTVRNRCRIGEILAEKDKGLQWLIHIAEIERLENNRHRLAD